MAFFDPRDKKVVFGTSDCNVIEPIKHQFAWDAFNTGLANFWLPTEVNMSADIQDWRGDKLTTEERTVVKRSMGFFSTAESLVVNNLCFAVYKHLTSPECRLFVLEQAHQEAVHTLSYQYIIESLNLDQVETYEMYMKVPAVRNKAEWAQKFSDTLCSDTFKVTRETLPEFIRCLSAFYLCFEGVFFAAGFAQLFAIGRRNLLSATCEQIQYINRDELTHYHFGVDLINCLREEQPTVFTPELEQDITSIVKDAVALEKAYCADTMPNGYLGMSLQDYQRYLEFIGNDRLAAVGLSPVYPTRSNPLPWMDELFSLRKDTNFFEKKVKEYSREGLTWDD